MEPTIAIAGGGPAGIAAALGAARLGCRTILIEYHDVLGGMGTAGLVNNFCNAYYDGNRFIIGGVFRELRQELIEKNALYETRNMEPYEPATYGRVLDDMVKKAGVECVYGRKITSAQLTGSGLEIELDDGSSIRADGAVDATGNAILAHSAGLATTFGRKSDGAVMPLTMCYRITGIDLEAAERGFPNWIDTRNGEKRPVYIDPNTGEKNFFHSGHCEFIDKFIETDRSSGKLSIPRDHVAVIQGVPGTPGDATINYGRVFIEDPTDPMQMDEATKIGIEQVHDGIDFFRRNLPGFEKVKLLELARQIGVRQSRQIEGLYKMTAEECLDCKQFEDAIAQCCYMIDIHEPGSDKSTLKKIPTGHHFDIPWRSLVPKNSDSRIAAAGRCISSDAGAMASFRVQPSAMAIGEAAGIGVALAAKAGIPLKNLSHRKVQQRLMETGAILT